MNEIIYNELLINYAGQNVLQRPQSLTVELMPGVPISEPFLRGYYQSLDKGTLIAVDAKSDKYVTVHVWESGKPYIIKKYSPEQKEDARELVRRILGN